MILVTGGTGNVGRELVKILSSQGQPTRVVVRSVAQAQAITLPGIELVEADFRKPMTIAPALDGVTSLFLLIPSSAQVEKQQRNLVDQAKESGVKYIAKLSQFGAHSQCKSRFQRHHGIAEDYIRDSGIEYTLLRPNLFMQGLLNFATIPTQGAFYAPAGRAKVSVVDARDVASVAAVALTDPGHGGKIYDITGPQALTHDEMADQLSQAVGKRILYVEVSPDIMLHALTSFGIPEWQAEGVVEDYEHYRRGEADLVTTTVRDITGRPARSFSQFAQDYATSFIVKAAGHERMAKNGATAH